MIFFVNVLYWFDDKNVFLLRLVIKNKRNYYYEFNFVLVKVFSFFNCINILLLKCLLVYWFRFLGICLCFLY